MLLSSRHIRDMRCGVVLAVRRVRLVCVVRDGNSRSPSACYRGRVWLLIFLGVVVVLAVFLWWVIRQPATEPRADLSGAFGMSGGALETDRELHEAVERQRLADSGDHQS
jgi:hypothetical protein